MAEGSRNSVGKAPDQIGEPTTFNILTTGCTTHRLSQHDADGLSRYRVFLAYPKAPAPPDGFGLICLLDGNAAFDRLKPAALEAVPHLAVAGIGYRTERQFAREERTFDYTPTAQGGMHADTDHPPRPAGGADRFLSVLSDRLLSQLSRDLPLDASRRTLWGHSFGGLCCLYALFTGGRGFTRFASASPSIWWNEAKLRDIEARAETPAGARLLITLGDREKRTGSDGPPVTEPSPATMALAARLEGRPDLSVETRVLHGMGHGATFAASLPQALRFAAS